MSCLILGVAFVLGGLIMACGSTSDPTPAAESQGLEPIQEELGRKGFAFEAEQPPTWGRNSDGTDWDALVLHSSSGAALWLRITLRNRTQTEVTELGRRWRGYLDILAKRFVLGSAPSVAKWVTEVWRRMNDSSRSGYINLRTDSRYFNGVPVEVWSHYGDLFELDRELTESPPTDGADGFWIVAFGEGLSQQIRALSPGAELPRPATRVGKWRDALLHSVVWVDEEFPEGARDLPGSLHPGTSIETDGPENPFSLLGCRAIFIVGEPPYADVHGRNIEIWGRRTIQVPDRLDGHHVWQFRTVNCLPWRIVGAPQ